MVPTPSEELRKSWGENPDRDGTIAASSTMLQSLTTKCKRLYMQAQPPFCNPVFSAVDTAGEALELRGES